MEAGWSCSKHRTVSSSGPPGNLVPERNERGMLVVAIGREVTTDEVASAIDEDREGTDT